MVVLAVVALAAGVIGVALRDSTADVLERDAVRLAALLEAARVEARASGLPVRWMIVPDGSDADFRFVGLPEPQRLPTHWLDARVHAQVLGGASLVLGPEPILPAQRVQLRLDERSLDVASDGLRPFAPAASAGESP